MRRFGPLVVGVVAACGTQHGAGAGRAPTTVGDYGCRIREDDFDYPVFRCAVRAEGGRFLLEKLGGTVRFRGVIATSADGFEFTGEVYCPEGDCTEPVHGTFRPAGEGTHVATFSARHSGPTMTVTLLPATMYGGDGYGGDDYGGTEYGGNGYGQP